jgi:hypothetical protein
MGTHGVALIALFFQIAAVAYALPHSMDAVEGLKHRVGALVVVMLVTFLSVIVSVRRGQGFLKLDFAAMGLGVGATSFLLYLIYS